MNKQPEITEITRKNLMDAFWKIYEEKGLASCSVKKVTELAGYCRSTFYEYFSDIPDLLEQLENEIIEFSIKDVEALFTNTNMAQIRKSVINLHRVYGKEFYTFMIKNRNMSFYLKLKSAVCETVLSSMKTEAGEQYAPYVVEFAAAGYLNCFMRWYQEGQEIPLEDIGNFIFELLRHGVLPASKRIVKSQHMDRLIFARE